MEYRYDPEVDCAYIYINKLPHSYTRSIDEVRLVDYAADGTVIGIELLYVGSGVDVAGLPYAQEVAELLRSHGVQVLE